MHWQRFGHLWIGRVRTSIPADSHALTSCPELLTHSIFLDDDILTISTIYYINLYKSISAVRIKIDFILYNGCTLIAAWKGKLKLERVTCIIEFACTIHKSQSLLLMTSVFQIPERGRAASKVELKSESPQKNPQTTPCRFKTNIYEYSISIPLKWRVGKQNVNMLMTRILRHNECPCLCMKHKRLLGLWLPIHWHLLYLLISPNWPKSSQTILIYYSKLYYWTIRTITYHNHTITITQSTSGISTQPLSIRQDTSGHPRWHGPPRVGPWLQLVWHLPPGAAAVPH